MKIRITFAALILLALLVTQFVPAPQLALAAATCDWAQFISDVTVPDGAAFKAGDSFNKTWRVKNVGSCTWSTDYSLVFVSGAQMGAPASVKLPKSVAPDQTIDLTVTMTAPATSGTHRGYWQLKNAAGKSFGIGANADKSWWVEIKVTTGSTSSTTFDFAANASAAQWSSGAGSLPFPGTSGDAKGFAQKLDAPKLENGATDSAPGLLTAPQNTFNGYIQGIYPAVKVESGDRFQAIIGCEYNATACYVTFRLDYQVGSSPVQTFWSFTERYEGLFYRANVDLSSLAGKDVKFILRINAAGAAAGDRALWGSPRIVRASGGPTVTPTATGTPATPTPTKTPGSATVTPTPNAGCDRATFVADVTIPDGSKFAPNTGFTKTWRILNSGTCTWNTSYSMVFHSGEKMGGSDVAFSKSIAPGQTIDLMVKLTAPAANGTYRGYWILKNPTGNLFGIGAGANKPFWVDIQVVGSSVTVTPTKLATPVPGVAYDFVGNACLAQWVSGAGVLPCPGAEGDARGFVRILDKPKLENGATDTVPGLLTVPQAGTNTYIQGVYPVFKVEKGDRFLATIGCEFGATACFVNYRVDYQVGSQPVQSFWTFNERYEGLFYKADLDLSPLAGKEVKFILTILSNGASSGDRALWGGARIVRGASASSSAPTVTPTPLPTSTPTPSAPTATPTGTATGTANWNIFQNTIYGFTFKFPSGGSIATQTDNDSRVTLPIVPGTNLSEKFIEVKVVEDTSPCKATGYENPTTVGNVVFNGITFLKETGQGVAAGNTYEWEAYSTTNDTACISMVFVLRSANPGNFPTPPPTFDKAAESAIFADIMNTFAILP